MFAHGVNVVGIFFIVDLILFMIDATKSFGPGDEFIIEELKKVKVPVFLILNKVDILDDIVKLKENVDLYKAAFNTNIIAIIYL